MGVKTLDSGLMVSTNVWPLLTRWLKQRDPVASVLVYGQVLDRYSYMGDLAVVDHDDWPGNYLDLEEEFFTYTPTGKRLSVADDGRWLPEGRQKIKPAKFVRAMLNATGRAAITDVDLEQFANRVKAAAADRHGAFSIVAGEEIRRWYHADHYADGGGNLFKSCMRYAECQPYFDLYVANPDKVQMLAFINGAQKLLGRALLWRTEEAGEVMDRVYGTDATVEMFRQWAREHGTPYKTVNGVDRPLLFTFPQGQREQRLSVALATWKLDRFPFCDTFHILTEDGVLRNSANRVAAYYYTLRDTHGGPRLRVACRTCQVLVDPHDWMEDGECYACWIARHCQICRRDLAARADPNNPITNYCPECQARMTCASCGNWHAEGNYLSDLCHVCATRDFTCAECGTIHRSVGAGDDGVKRCKACEHRRAERKKRDAFFQMPKTRQTTATTMATSSGPTYTISGGATSMLNRYLTEQLNAELTQRMHEMGRQRAALDLLNAAVQARAQAPREGGPHDDDPF